MYPYPPSVPSRLALPTRSNPSRANLEYTPNNAHSIILRRLLLLRSLQLLNTSPPRRGRNPIPTNSELPFPHASVDIDILELDEQRAVGGALEPAVKLPPAVQDDQQGAGEVELEESLGVEVGAADGVEGDVELGDEGDGVDQDADVGAVDAEGGLVGEFVEGVAVCFPVEGVSNSKGLLDRENGCANLPRRTETDVSKADSAVDEDDGKTRQGQEPVEDVAAVVCQVDECQAAEEELNDDHGDRAALLVDLGHELGCHACAYY